MGTTPSTVPDAGAVPGANAVPGVPGANAVPGVLSTASSTPLPSGNSPFPPGPQRPHIQHQKGIAPGAYGNRRIGIMPLPFQSHYTLCVQHILKLHKITEDTVGVNPHGLEQPHAERMTLMSEIVQKKDFPLYIALEEAIMKGVLMNCGRSFPLLPRRRSVYFPVRYYIMPYSRKSQKLLKAKREGDKTDGQGTTQLKGVATSAVITVPDAGKIHPDLSALI